jgi:hypothetical protein
MRIAHCPVSQLLACFPVRVRLVTLAILAGPILMSCDVYFFYWTGLAFTIQHLVLLPVSGKQWLDTTFLGWVIGVCLWQGTVCALASFLLKRRMPPWASFNVIHPIVVWMGDANPSPFAPGAHSPRRFDLFGFSVRHFLATALLLHSYVACCAAECNGVCHMFKASIVLCPIGLFCELLIAATISFLLLGILIAPLFAYVAQLAQARD